MMGGTATRALVARRRDLALQGRTVGAGILGDQGVERGRVVEQARAPALERSEACALLGGALRPARKRRLERRGVKRVAVYMDEAGKRHECSAVCTHLGGLVSWDRAERSWDCPCHGSRFDPYGRVVTGPAKRDLEPVHAERETIPVEIPPSAE